ncbi:MAG TPA: protein translocase subunit SecF [Rhodothermales bacterium]|nr:protein translocase subunit SecF [Rhodothermales bacterium]
MRFFEKTNFDFIGARKKAYIFSGTLILISLISLAFRGLQLGIDFTGGMEFIVETSEELGANQVRQALGTALEREPEVKIYGQDQLLIKAPPTGEITEVQARIQQAIRQAFPGSNPTILQSNLVGPRFAADLQQGAIYSIIGAIIVILIYVWIRFQLRFGLGAIVALAHDTIITVGAFSLLHGIAPFSLTVDQTVIAALMTIVGFSINDTVVVFDRIREYMVLFKTEPLGEIINRSINTTLSRTIITTGTILMVLIVLFIFGGEVLRPFSFALLVGMTIGTYSSIFVASPIVLELGEHKRHKAAARR